MKINFVKDRPGHDYRYALDSKKQKLLLIGVRQKILKKA